VQGAAGSDISRNHAEISDFSGLSLSPTGEVNFEAQYLKKGRTYGSPLFACAFPAVPASKGSSLRSHVAGRKAGSFRQHARAVLNARSGKFQISAMLPDADDTVVLGRFAWGRAHAGKL